MELNMSLRQYSRSTTDTECPLQELRTAVEKLALLSYQQHIQLTEITEQLQETKREIGSILAHVKKLRQLNKPSGVKRVRHIFPYNLLTLKP